MKMNRRKSVNVKLFGYIKDTGGGGVFALSSTSRSLADRKFFIFIDLTYYFNLSLAFCSIY